MPAIPPDNPALALFSEDEIWAACAVCGRSMTYGEALHGDELGREPIVYYDGYSHRLRHRCGKCQAEYLNAKEQIGD